MVSLAALTLQAAAGSLAWRVLPMRLPHQAPWSLAASRAYAALGWCGSFLYGGAIGATLLALALRSDPLHAAAADLLSPSSHHGQPGQPGWPGRPWARLSALSFSLYLCHEQARFLAVRFLLPPGLLAGWAASAPATSFVLLSAISLAAGYAAAVLCHRLAEQRRWL